MIEIDLEGLVDNLQCSGGMVEDGLRREKVATRRTSGPLYTFVRRRPGMTSAYSPDSDQEGDIRAHYRVHQGR